MWRALDWRPLRLLASFSCVAVITSVAYSLLHVNATTVGFAYLLLVLVIASTWGFVEAALTSVLATRASTSISFPQLVRSRSLTHRTGLLCLPFSRQLSSPVDYRL